MEHLKKYWWIYALLLVIVILIIFLVASKKGGRGGAGSGNGTGNGDGDIDPDNGSSGTPQQTLRTYTCETKKVCQGRGGFANWVKTGNQKKCNCNNVCQGLCLWDCKGTCYTWES